jgi:hypothetical protein
MSARKWTSYWEFILLAFHYSMVIWAPSKEMLWNMAFTTCLLTWFCFSNLCWKSQTRLLWCSCLYNNFLSYPRKKCFIFLNFITIEKLHQQITSWCSPLDFKQPHKSNLQCPSLFYFSHMNPIGNFFQLLCIWLFYRCKHKPFWI